MTVFKQPSIPFTYVSPMPIFKVPCYRCGEMVVQPVDWSHMVGAYPPRQLAACGDCMTYFMQNHLPGVADKAHQAPCGTCNGERVVDSGGQNFDGSWISIPCPECRGVKYKAVKIN
jgi:hypothetical protein